MTRSLGAGGSERQLTEARAPFLDHTLWDFAAPLPFKVRLHGGRIKAVLREIVRRRISPAVANRPKQGFTIPVSSWLATRWRGPGLAEALQQAFRDGRVPVQLWHLLVLERWMRQLRAPVL